jgi:hypothetical protein
MHEFVAAAAAAAAAAPPPPPPQATKAEAWSAAAARCKPHKFLCHGNDDDDDKTSSNFKLMAKFPVLFYTHRVFIRGREKLSRHALLGELYTPQAKASSVLC